MDEKSLQSLKDRYLTELPQLDRAKIDAENRIQSAMTVVGIQDASLKTRVKNVSSMIKTVITKYSESDDPWTMVTDKVGAQVTVHTLIETDRLRALLEAGFTGLSYLRTIERGPKPKELAYSATHVQVEIDGATTTDGAPIECEIQIRTHSQHGWAYIEHWLLYKRHYDFDTPDWMNRRISRLSVLTEMFDEEVVNVINELATDHRYLPWHLLDLSERNFVGIAPNVAGDRDLSLEILRLIADTFIDNDKQGYEEHLADFVDANRDRITEAIHEYGQGSPFAGQFSYLLFSQPESIVIWERLARRPLALKRSVEGSPLRPAIAALADVWGVPIDD